MENDLSYDQDEYPEITLKIGQLASTVWTPSFLFSDYVFLRDYVDQIINDKSTNQFQKLDLKMKKRKLEMIAEISTKDKERSNNHDTQLIKQLSKLVAISRISSIQHRSISTTPQNEFSLIVPKKKRQMSSQKLQPKIEQSPTRPIFNIKNNVSMDIEPKEFGMTPFDMLVDIKESPFEENDSAVHYSPTGHQRYDTLGFICLENIPEEDKKIDGIRSPNTSTSRLSNVMLESVASHYNFTPRAYNLKPKRLSELNQKGEVIILQNKSYFQKLKHKIRKQQTNFQPITDLTKSLMSDLQKNITDRINKRVENRKQELLKKKPKSYIRQTEQSVQSAIESSLSKIQYGQCACACEKVRYIHGGRSSRSLDQSSQFSGFHDHKHASPGSKGSQLGHEIQGRNFSGYNQTKSVNTLIQNSQSKQLQNAHLKRPKMKKSKTHRHTLEREREKYPHSQNITKLNNNNSQSQTSSNGHSTYFSKRDRKLSKNKVVQRLSEIRSIERSIERSQQKSYYENSLHQQY